MCKFLFIYSDSKADREWAAMINRFEGPYYTSEIMTEEIRPLSPDTVRTCLDIDELLEWCISLSNVSSSTVQSDLSCQHDAIKILKTRIGFYERLDNDNEICLEKMKTLQNQFLQLSKTANIKPNQYGKLKSSLYKIIVSSKAG